MQQQPDSAISFMNSARKRAVSAVYRTADIIGINHLLAQSTAGRLRILAYHGVCPDQLRNAPWVPPFFVTLSDFTRQMEYIRSRFRPVSLRSALETLRRRGSFEPNSVAVTFDDGYANNLSVALPVLERLQIPATVFLCTRWVDDGELLPHDKVRLIKLRQNCSTGVPPVFARFKNLPIRELLHQLEELWPPVRDSLTEIQRQALRVLTWEEIAVAPRSLLEFGAHTHQHAILGNESGQARRDEILDSLTMVRQRTGIREPFFSYPNGLAGDFDDTDKAVAASGGAPAALAGFTGINSADDDCYRWKRLPVGIGHSKSAFRAEISGLRRLLMAAKQN